MNRKSKFNRQVEFTFANEIGNKNVEKRLGIKTLKKIGNKNVEKRLTNGFRGGILTKLSLKLSINSRDI